ncbi:DUF397 domain-containing protein [Streptomyces sp. ISL-99]|uniref:DUF397 domain-containing protein n=1 Tax=Streptomyces sp. ISL-99 TaxID=2819193 RepID=UPI001BE590C9|nr:DUF397 domain-containing protein [Streptomyces sp. ISL-99]MBT2524072.1 DUF397 domain-containing protein [Streptomyces sp. ISL-99]
MQQSNRIDLGSVRWRKSSYSNSSGGDCVEVADGITGVVPVRDSKSAPHGPAVVVSTGAWAEFVMAVRRGEVCA